MSAAEPGGTPPGGAHLQPGEGVDAGSLVDPGFLAEAAIDLACLEVNDPGEANAVETGDREMQRWEDLETVNDLAFAGFSGPRYDLFANALAGYGYPVMRSWLRRGLIFKFCRDRGRPVPVTDHDREFLADPRPDREAADERKELSLETNARALVFFRDRVLLEERWSFDGGASLKTYFMGACLLQFPNVFEAWSTDRHRRRYDRVEAADLNGPVESANGPDVLFPAIDVDPAAAAVTTQTVAEALNGMKGNIRAAAGQLLLADASYADIAAELGISERAVEGLFHRHRKKVSNRAEQRRTP